ncbi:MAG: hypothetical protein V2I40_13395 [Desulfobacteraceae bacterium]|jgi:hypothetical protein|nr:hypothetical protein [Desulfobacteraceae bacterium]
MAFTCKRIKTVAGCLIGILIAGGWLATAGLAADKGNPKQNAVAIRQIRNVRESRVPDATIRPQDVFDVVGSLNAIDGNQITIADRRLTLAPDVSASGIAKWAQVGVKLNSAGEVAAIEIVSDEPH